MDFILELFNNSSMQSLILGPLMGVVFAAIFAGLTKSPAAEAPSTIVQTKRVYITRVVERRSSSNGTDDGIGLLIGGGIALLLVLWNYAIYYEAIHYYLAVAILTISSFSLTTIFISFLKGHYTSSEWWVYTIGPMLALIACAFLLNLARESFEPAIREGALKHSLWTFYHDWLSDDGRYFMFTHVGGVVLLTFVILLVGLSLIYYLSLMNQRTNGFSRGLWFFLARTTSFFSGRFWLFLIAILLIISYLGLNPNLAAKWLSNR